MHSTHHMVFKNNRIVSGIIYDKDIPIVVSANQDLDQFTSSKSLEKEFKRTLSRLYELTSRKLK